jgi:uncharacterized membrane-anchored protein YhcB (DUF1043 family)
MDPKEIQEIVYQALQDGVSIKWWSYVILALIVLLGSYIGAYLKRKGENFATKEDFNQLLDQVKRTTEETEKIKNEFYLTKATYDKYIEVVLNFYSNIYKYYRSCQKAASSTHIKYPDDPPKTTKELWEKELDKIVENHTLAEGYIRLLLPENIHKINSNLIDAFNKFRDIIKYDSEGIEKQNKLEDCFNNDIDPYKQELESALRRFLKIDQLTKFVA